MNTKAAAGRRVEETNKSKRTLLLTVLGLLAIGAAWGVRSNVLAKRRAQANLLAARRTLVQQSALQIAVLRRETADHPQDIRAHRALASLYAQHDMPDLFVGEAETIARLTPADPDAQLTLASAYGALKKWPQAAERYLAIVEKWPDSAAGWQGLSITFYSLKQYKRAMWAAEHALRLQPDDPHNRFGLAASQIEWAIQSSRMGIHSELIDHAQQELTKLLPSWPDKAGIYFLLGRADTALGKVDLAVQQMQEANRLQPDSSEIAYGLGHLYLRQQRRAEGRRVVEKALASNPQDANLVELLGQLWQDSPEPDAAPRALAQFEQAARLEPKNPLFQERFGSACLHAGNTARARSAFEEAIRLDPNRSFPYQQLAVIYVRLGDRARAAKIAQAAKELEFNEQQLKHLQSLVFTHPENVELHLELADRYRYLGLKSLAEDEYGEAKRLDPHNARADNALKALAGQTSAPSHP